MAIKLVPMTMIGKFLQNAILHLVEKMIGEKDKSRPGHPSQPEEFLLCEVSVCLRIPPPPSDPIQHKSCALFFIGATIFCY